MAALIDVLATLSLEAKLPLFEEDELTLELLQWMAAHDGDFLSSMSNSASPRRRHCRYDGSSPVRSRVARPRRYPPRRQHPQQR